MDICLRWATIWSQRVWNYFFLIFNELFSFQQNIMKLNQLQLARIFQKTIFSINFNFFSLSNQQKWTPKEESKWINRNPSNLVTNSKRKKGKKEKRKANWNKWTEKWMRIVGCCRQGASSGAADALRTRKTSTWMKWGQRVETIPRRDVNLCVNHVISRWCTCRCPTWANRRENWENLLLRSAAGANQHQQPQTQAQNTKKIQFSRNSVH